MAFVKDIDQNSEDSHQTSPAYVLTFTRFENRDNVNYKSKSAEGTRKPLVVVNDAVNVGVNFSKSSPTPMFSCTLKQGDLNYITAVAPGDYVTVNMVNWQTKAMEIRERALIPSPINKVDDGFKGLFKILDVNMVLATASDGTKQYYVQITGRGFDEFNNVLYFNPALATEARKVEMLFINNFNNWQDFLRKRETNNVQNLVKEVIKRAIGEGVGSGARGGVLQQTPAYKVPQQVGKLLNKPSAYYAADINNYYLGIWNPKSGSSKSKSYSGFSSFFTKDEGDNFFKTGTDLPGSRAISFQDFQNIKVWSLLNDYSNPVLNEVYNCYRVDEKGEFVYPSTIVRQKVFNTRHYEKFANGSTTPHTKFLDIPRWRISPNLITSLNIGRSDSGRINFCQVFTRAQSIDPKFDQTAQIVLGNFVEDEDDIIRNGRKPFVASCNYDFAGSDTELRAKKWAYLVADWVFNGHLKMNGSMECVGIEDPICVGDNLELDNIVYHIETISHNIILNPAGFKTFRTNLTLSMGVSESSTSSVPVYAEMDYTDARTRREDDYKKEKILPGFSDTQDLPSRERGEETKETKEQSFSIGKDTKADKFNKFGPNITKKF